MEFLEVWDSHVFRDDEVRRQEKVCSWLAVLGGRTHGAVVLRRALALAAALGHMTG